MQNRAATHLGISRYPLARFGWLPAAARRVGAGPSKAWTSGDRRVFYSPEPLELELGQAGIPVVDLQKGGRWENLSFMLRLRRAIRDASPDVVYSFVGGANVFAAAVRPFIPATKLVWSIRSSDMDLTRYDWAHRFGSAIERRLSRVPDLIISNSQAGLEFAATHDFPRERIVVVPNGIYVERFRPDASLRRSQRAEWGLASNEVAVGMLARLDAMKGYPDFLVLPHEWLDAVAM